jgi:hypothetical protein
VRLIVDGPTLEVSTRWGVLGAPIAPAGSGLEVSADGRVGMWPLTRAPEGS